MFFFKSSSPFLSLNYPFTFFPRRAKLYIYGETLLNKGKGVNSWNERGTGDIKILK
jgi:hypothetical protein